MSVTLKDLPPEIVEAILGHLPTASDITNASSTCKKLHEVFKHSNNTIFRNFVQRQFPTVEAKAPWQVAVSRLTSRSRAWDQRALIARTCTPPSSEDGPTQPFRHGRTNGTQTIGVAPVIDSLEDDQGREVVAWGAGGRLRMRIRDGKAVNWSSLCFEQDSDPQTDIIDLHLLRPRQNQNVHGQSVLIRRANREISLVHSLSTNDEWTRRSTFRMGITEPIDCVDMSESVNPVLVVCNSTSINLFPVHDGEQDVKPSAVHQLSEEVTIRHRKRGVVNHQQAATHQASPAVNIRQRKRCAKFLGLDRIAVAPQYLNEQEAAPIEIFQVGESEIDVQSKLMPFTSLSAVPDRDGGPGGRIGANVMRRVEHCGTDRDSRDLLLSGWSDGIVRLYDLRASQIPVRQFSDPVDDGQIFSMTSIGLERLLVGSHQNGCIKTFDMRMNARVYDYTQAPRPVEVKSLQDASSDSNFLPAPSIGKTSRSLREINIFMAVSMKNLYRDHRPSTRRNPNFRVPRYNGAIYSLSSPSASSSTIYVGIENHVMQLDTICSDDWLLNRGNIQSTPMNEEILDISCYERPREGRESTDHVLLRKQRSMQSVSEHGRPQSHDGWDERWYLEQHRCGRRGSTSSWR